LFKMALDRGIEDIAPRLGDFVKLVEQRINRGDTVRILDAGCGYGTAMMGFVKQVGSKVQLIGFNSSERHGTLETMRNDVIKKGLFAKDELEQIPNLPRIVYFDASDGLPFESDSFDFIYSINSLHYYDDKIHFLEECNRVLKEGGIARIGSAFGNHYFGLRAHTPEKYPGFWEIWDKGEEVDAWVYLNQFKGVKTVYEPATNKEEVPQYIEIQKQAHLDFKLRLIASIDFNFIWRDWSGVKSIYTTQLEFRPKWKKA
ncbi:class I SAM-dependent methyltransferase, partial [Candidatus Woesearchaeota archaeon]|nr:class I SAM-dependent methyltransferase [Candidatus Woesearchaeota archaeon]